jgi:putative transposase
MENGECHRKKCHRYNFPGNAHELTFSCFRGRPFLSKDRTRGYLVDAIIAAMLQAIKQPVSRRATIYLRQHNPKGLTWLATGEKGVRYRFWQAGGGYDRNMTSVETIVKAAKYIHENPVRRGLVTHAGEWVYSSARAWETGTSSLLPIDFDTFPTK